MIELVLGIESSCDETAASVVRRGKEVLSNVVSSQIEVHREFGGVVPELASRKHVEAIIPVIEGALRQAGVGMGEIDGVAVTAGPGLMGCLMVGVSAAKSLSYGLDIPLIGVDHLESHIAAAFLEHEPPFPFIGLITSGGHTSLYMVSAPARFELLGKTRDDAAGEAFDKAAKLLGLRYPGGVEIDRVASSGDRDAIKFPRPFLKTSSNDFSFSGVKTALVYYLKEQGVLDGWTESEGGAKGGTSGGRINGIRLEDVCASYQEAIVETLVNKTLYAARTHGVSEVVISGGVACNSRLRELASERFGEEGISHYIPSPELCTDNAAMIASLGFCRFEAGERSTLELSPYSTRRPRYIRGRGLMEG